MAQITITVPANKVQAVQDAFADSYPIPKDDTGTPLFTTAQWPKEVLIRFIKDTDQIYRKHLADLAIAPDDTVAS